MCVWESYSRALAQGTLAVGPSAVLSDFDWMMERWWIGDLEEILLLDGSVVKLLITFLICSIGLVAGSNLGSTKGFEMSAFICAGDGSGTVSQKVCFSQWLHWNTAVELLVQETFQLCSAIHSSVTLLLLLSSGSWKLVFRDHLDCCLIKNKASQNLLSWVKFSYKLHS